MNTNLVEGRIVRYYPRKGAHGYPAVVVRTFGSANYCNLNVLVDGVNGALDGFTEDEQTLGRRLAFSVLNEAAEGLGDDSPRWGWPPR